MKNLLKNITATAVFVGIAAGSTLALADASDLRMLQETKITLVEAIEAAQKSSGGVAYEASLDDDSFSPTYEVNVAKDGRSFDVRVDAVNGKVTGTREDLDD